MKFALGILTLVGGVAALVWMYWQVLKRAEDPARIVWKTVLSVVVAAGTLYLVGKALPAGEGAGFGAGAGIAFYVVGLAAACGLVLAILWRGHLLNAVTRPIDALFAGGAEEPDPEPVFGPAIARRKQDNPRGDLAELNKQLERFPGHFEVLMMQAEIQAQDLHDLDAARRILQGLLAEARIKPGQAAMVLNTLADWELQYARDREAALAALRQVEQRYPGTSVAQIAAQRIAHLPSQETLDQQAAPRPVHLTEGPRDRLVLPGDLKAAPPQTSPGDRAQELVRHLEEHPRDAAGREELARIYAAQFQRLDLATDQIEQLIRMPGQSVKKVVGWLNLLADLQVQHGGQEAAAAAALERIERLFPDSAAAQQARERRSLLGREFRSRNATSRVIRLGSYEKDIGLRGSSRLT